MRCCGGSPTIPACRPRHARRWPSRPTTSASTASVWEIAIKRALGKLGAPDDLPAHVEAAGFGWLPVTAEHAWQVRELALHHRDPFDRLLVAQSLVERMPIVSADPRFGVYDVEVRW